MMGFETVGFLHFVAAVGFGGFILLDRLAFRRFASSIEGGANGFYRALRPWLLLLALVLIVSGTVLLVMRPELLMSFGILLKVIGGLALIGLFFYCPLYAKRAGRWRRFAYRQVVLGLLLLVLFLGRGVI